MSPPIAMIISRSSLTLRECPPELAAELNYVRQDITFEAGSFKSTPVKVSYAHYDHRTRVCRTFPNALHLVQKTAKHLGFEMNVTDQRIRPQLDLDSLEDGDFPTVCFRALEEVIRANSSGLIVTASETDKTSILCGLVRLLPKHYKVLVTTEDKAGVNQIHAALTKAVLDETIGIHDKPVSNPRRIIVTHIDTLNDFTQGELAYSGWALREFDAWICDEVHRLPVPSRIPLLSRFRTVFGWGLTSTPDPADNSHQLNAIVFGPTLFRAGHQDTVEIQQGAREGILAINVLVFPLPAEKPIPEDWPFHAKIRAAYMKNPKLGLLLNGIDAALPESSKVMVFVDTLRLGILLRKFLPRYPFIHSKLPQNLRQREIDRWKRGDINRMICTVTGSEGINVPDLDYIIDCSTELSPNLIIQWTGGAVRSAADKQIRHYILFLCLASEHLFNNGIRKLQCIEKMGSDVRYMFHRSVADALRFEQTPLLSELGTFTES